uniref:NUMOD4 domain-containing protein n=1 Tax=viral metagenome TaxID=1070528 RepID=A0A6C0JNP7_9ZZZZ
MCTLEFLETIKEYPNYEISNLGRVYNRKKAHLETLLIMAGI